MFVMMLAGIPLYVCSSGSVPIALALVRMGISPGAAFVFLVTGPATNVATIATVWRLAGRAATLVYLGTIAGMALLFGILLDLVVDPATMSGYGVSGHDSVPLWKTVSGVVLLLLLLPSIVKKGRACQD
jgi:hypothetical protein